MAWARARAKHKWSTYAAHTEPLGLDLFAEVDQAQHHGRRRALALGVPQAVVEQLTQHLHLRRATIMVSSASEALDAVHRSRRATHLAARSREGDVEGRGSCRRGCRRRRRAADTASTRSLQQQQARNRRSHASPQHYQQPTPPLRRSVASEQTGRDCAPARTLVQLGHRRDESLAARWPHSRRRHRPQRRRLRGGHLLPTSRLTRTNNREKWAPAAALPCQSRDLLLKKVALAALM
jgi:hypothetical protein